jgi:hypothetical protein
MVRSRIGALLLLAVAVHACAREDTNGAAPDTAQAPAAAVQPAAVSAEQFASLSWLIGDWRGSGGQYPAFYESYRMLNDSTIEMRTYSDSTFTKATETSELGLRSGSIQSLRDGTVRSVVTRISGDSVFFGRPNGAGGKFVWVKGPEGQWTAVLDGASGAPPTVYEMRRIPSSTPVF